MSEYFIHYIESNVVCLIIFGLILAHNLFKMDRRESIIKFDCTLVAFMCYFVSDSIWAAVICEVIPKNDFTVILTNFLNYIIMSAITYTWLYYVMSIENTPNREQTKHKIAILFPFVITTVAIITTYIAAPGVLIDGNLEPRPVYYAFQSFVPIVYIVAVLIYALRKVKREADAQKKATHIYIGFFPLIVLAGGVFQLFLLNTSVFCFCCTIFMLIFYIRSLEKQISIDPLTGLNNRGQLDRYVLQNASAYKDGRQTFVIMMDVNDFKSINDNYGHAEGDRTLITIAKALKTFVNNSNFPCFLGRYGGDEFLLIIHLGSEADIDTIISDIRSHIENERISQNFPFAISVGIGFDKFSGENDTYNKCILRADNNLYFDKERLKADNKSNNYN